MNLIAIDVYSIYSHKGKNLSVKFNEDVTILYGNNGCGKTTLLNILSIIVSGKLYLLINYKFERIVVEYNSKDNNSDSIQKIIISTEKKEKKIIYKIEFDNQSHEIENLIDLYRYGERNNIDELFFEKYSFAIEIKKTFNYTYLPLDRNGDISNMYEEIFYSHYRNIHVKSNYKKDFLSESISRAENMVKNYIMDMNVKIADIDEIFRKEILGKMSDLSNVAPIDESFKENISIDDDDVEHTKKSYMDALTENKIMDDDKRKKIEEFIQSFLKNRKENNSKNHDNSSMLINYAWTLFQYLKMKEVAKSSEKHDTEKNNIYLQRNKFIKTINNFFSNKEIDITENGNLKIIQESDEITSQDLSSGEKQLLITFITLYFGMENNKNGIFIVDEPESSLHIDWQRELIKSMLSANENIQLVFATHSPEIVSYYREKMYEIK